MDYCKAKRLYFIFENCVLCNVTFCEYFFLRIPNFEKNESISFCKFDQIRLNVNKIRKWLLCIQRKELSTKANLHHQKHWKHFFASNSFLSLKQFSLLLCLKADLLIRWGVRGRKPLYHHLTAAEIPAFFHPFSILFLLYLRLDDYTIHKSNQGSISSNSFINFMCKRFSKFIL